MVQVDVLFTSAPAVSLLIITQQGTYINGRLQAH
jgi:hypothetical protein